MDQQHPSKADHPITIGLLMNDMNDPNGNALWRGVSATLLENNCNLVCFAGGSPYNPFEDDNQRTILYNLVDVDLLDGLLVWSGPINAYLGPEEVNAFFKRFGPLPLVSIAMQIEGVTSIVLDNYQGMCDAVMHLVQEHDRRRIVFIKGTEGHQESNIRYNAYLDALAYSHIAFDPQLVLPGGFDAEFGRAAVHHLMENQIKFDAIVTNDDSVAIAAMQTLQQFHFDLPREISVIGFDDQAIAQSMEIPLTTVRIPNFDLGRHAARLLLKMVYGEGEVSDPAEMIPLQLTVRQSCGCTSPDVQQARLYPYRPLQEAFPEALLKRREDVLVELYLSVGNIQKCENRINALLDAFFQDLLANQPGAPAAFLGVLGQLLKGCSDMEMDVFVFQNVVTTMRRHILPILAIHTQYASMAEDLWQQARILIAEFARRIEVRQQILNKKDVLTLHTVNQALSTTQYFDQLAEVIFKSLPELGYESVYLSLYEDQSNPLAWSRLRIAYEKGQRVPLSKEGERFRSSKLVPNDILQSSSGQSWVVMPLHSHLEKIGFVVLKVGPLDGMIYEAARFQISSALKGVAVQKELMDLSLTDSLTGIGNRRSFEMFLNKEVDRNFRYHNGLSLIMVDLDDFKNYNDTFGHPAGDKALIEVAQVISSCARRGLDVVVRLGGDEFAALVTETDAEGAEILGECIRNKIESDPNFLKKMTASVGVTSMTAEENDSRNLIERCDKALYISKRNGRNRVTVVNYLESDSFVLPNPPAYPDDI
jgi:diguanylate cyclase (GGDEF)-like protein